ncbi:MAG: ABC transporter permease [Sphingobium sp.]|nr:ABC transporter permease [Sphingobium sp.]
MRSVLLVARREFKQIVATKGFWVMLMIVPIAIAVSGFASSKLQPERTSAYTIVDASGRIAPVIEQRLEIDYQRQALRDLSNYVDRWKLAHVDPQAPWANKGSWVVESEILRFMAAGGTDAALRKLRPAVPQDAPEFKAPDRFFVKVTPPATVPTDKGADAFGTAMAKPLQEDVATSLGKKPYALAVYIPRDFGAPGAVAKVWTSGRSIDGLIQPIRDTLTTVLRQRLLAANGVAPATAARYEAVRAPITITEPAAGKGRSIIVTKSIIPIALVYLLLITTITTGSMMLQGLVEERSNKLIESVLACIRPAALMHGKLLGLGAVGLCIVGVWVGFAVGGAYWTGAGVMAEVLKPSLEAIHEPWIVAAMIFYFLSGYLILSMVFLAIGSQSDSMQDAQAYLTPVLMLVMLPVMFLMQAALRDPNALFVQILSWIPFYTPFAMLARLGSGVSLIEILGTSVVLAVFIGLELIFLGRLFRASLLSAGKPKWRDMIAKLTAKAPSTQVQYPSAEESHNAA